MNPFDDDSEAKIFEPPPNDLLTGLHPVENTSNEDPLPEPFRALSPVPDVTPQLDDISANPSAKALDQLGQALRAGLGIGAMSILPDLIADLRRSRDPDSRLKFLTLAFKEGGYGVKEDKSANLPVFHFNFVGGEGTVTVTQDAPRLTLEAEEIEPAPAPVPDKEVPDDEDAFAALNALFD